VLLRHVLLRTSIFWRSGLADLKTRSESGFQEPTCQKQLVRGFFVFLAFTCDTGEAANGPNDPNEWNVGGD
jgi:hypothetical protein